LPPRRILRAEPHRIYKGKSKDESWTFVDPSACERGGS
jgi:hypothetical protein